MFCSKCGNEVKNGDKFCSKCGQALTKNLNKNNSGFCKKAILVSIAAFICSCILGFTFNIMGLEIGKYIAMAILYTSIIGIIVSLVAYIFIRKNEKMPNWVKIIISIIIVLVVANFIKSVIEIARDRTNQKNISVSEQMMNNTENEEIKENTNPIGTMEIQDFGTIKFELYPDKAPNTVKNFIALANNGFYDGLTFHRTIPDFVIQGGDPSGDGTGSASLKDLGLSSNEVYTIKGEFKENGYTNNTISHEKGTLSMARSDYSIFDASLIDEGYNSASCQFFITTVDNEELDGYYAAFGKVIEGMDIVDRIANVEVQTREEQDYGSELVENKPITPPIIKSIRVETYGIDYGLPETLKEFDINAWYEENMQ